MATAKLRKVGGSVMLAIPPAVLESARMQANSTVDLAVDEATGILSIKPSRPRYTLAELLAEQEFGPASAEDQAWLHDGSSGSEEI